MFRNLFRPDSPLMIVMTQITDCIFLSLFWMAGCFPLVTVGASTAAMYDAAYRGFRAGEKNCWQRFWQVFRRNWKAGIIPSVVFLVLVFGLGKGLIWVWNSAVAGMLSWALFSAAAFIAVALLGMISVLFPMLSRFENSTAGLLKNTVILALGNLPRTLILGALNTVSAYLCARFIFPLFFLPALAALLGSLLIEPMFAPYMPSKDAA